MYDDAMGQVPFIIRCTVDLSPNGTSELLHILCKQPIYCRSHGSSAYRRLDFSSFSIATPALKAARRDPRRQGASP